MSVQWHRSQAEVVTCPNSARAVSAGGTLGEVQHAGRNLGEVAAKHAARLVARHAAAGFVRILLAVFDTVVDGGNVARDAHRVG